MKKILLALGTGLTLAYLYGKRQVKNAQIVVSNIKFKVHRFNRFQINQSSIDINIDVKLINNSNIDFTVSSGNLINLKKVELFTDTGVKLAEAIKQIDNISLLANGVSIVEDVNVSIDTSNLGILVFQLISNSPEKLIIKAHVNILGQDFII